MPRPNSNEIDDSYERAGLAFDAEDEALLRHIFDEDAPPQGLHRGGRKPYCEKTGEHFFEGIGYGECVYCHKTPIEIQGRSSDV